MQIEKLNPRLEDYLNKHGLILKYRKQALLFETNPNHPSLHREKLIPKDLNLYSFRLDRKYRVIFILKNPNLIEVVDINNHYTG